jgi:hypothetical protein
VANHNYEKSSFPFSFACRFNFYFLRCKGKFKVKNEFASGSGKKSSRHTIRKTVRSGPAKKELGFAGLGRMVWIRLVL